MTPYAVGIDLGTTYSAAAVARGSTVEIFTLGTTAPQIPSVIVVREDGAILTGEAAERRASSEPARAAREFKRRLGDPVPIVVGGTPYGPEALMALLLKAIVEQVKEREGAAPEVIALTHPANYTEYKRGLVEEAARLAGLDLTRVLLLAEPEAAAIAYASQDRVDPGSVIAVYDLGGGTFDAAVVRRTETGFELLGTPEGMDRLGGIDFDQAVLTHVDSSLDGMVIGADGRDPAVRSGLVRLRDDARGAKEALSEDTDAAVLVALPGLQTEVRLTREELEAMVRPRIVETVAALQRSIASTGLTVADVSRVLLVGGASRMPVVGEEVRRATGRPVTTDAHPKFAIATGAALAGAAALKDDRVDAAAVAEVASTAETAVASGALGAAAVGAAAGGAATIAAHALAGGGSAAGATGLGPAGAGPAGVPLTTGPAGTPMPGVGPGGVDVEPPPKPPTSARPKRPRLRHPVAIAAGAIVGAAVVAGGIAIATQSGGDGETAAPTTTSARQTTAAGGPSTSSQPVPTAGRGLPGLVTVVAGNGRDDGMGRPGPADVASLGNSPRFAVAPNGDLFVTNHENELLLVSDGQTKVIYTADSAAGESGFGGVAVGPGGDAYVTMGTGVKRIGRDGSSTPVVDARTQGLRGGFGPITFDGAGNLYFFDLSTFRVLRWSGGGLSIVAGTGTQGRAGSPPDGDGGPAVAASLTGANAMVVDSAGNLLLAESGRPLIRQVAPNGTISTIVGGGTTPMVPSSGDYAPDGTNATDLALTRAAGVAVDAAGRVYVSDDQDHAIVRFTRDGKMELVGADQEGAVTDFATPANQFQIFTVGGLAFDSAGNLLFVQSNRIQRIADAGKG